MVRKRANQIRLSDIERACIGVGREWIRAVLTEIKKEGELEMHGSRCCSSLVALPEEALDEGLRPALIRENSDLIS